MSTMKQPHTGDVLHTVVRVVARELDCAPIELEPISDEFDIDAVETFFASQPHAEIRLDVYSVELVIDNTGVTAV
jgi:hypothetical protein